MKRALTAIIFGATVVGLLGGCANSRLVNSDVTSFSRWMPAPPAPGSSYRFERLLSQQPPDARQPALEGLAQAALAKVGLQHNPQAAAFSVQVSATTQPIMRPRWDGYPYGGGSSIFIGSGIGGGGGSVGFGFGIPIGVGMESPLYRRDVNLVIRELRGNTAVYETRAFSEDPWADDGPVISTMLDAALRNFPVPPVGTRRISIEIQR
ncbi:DUF4136 domain-containing protein [Polaromonas eurypsychrophila]|uniref:DUF4136 domain-containing protein n=1 Tax=Polaromonas eurypsychrophila TaxID=1614635 RepID=A0A916SCP4_9BURK|nr:DUF4136 domain-containing protein [Polaromonas eurypsychrophila]GGA93000.1 hypothetical protein GCM10011496_12520 [Polaromonas eurypsychrophila]